jgi:hypothetical protein
MALTLSVIAGIALLLPGLFGILFWNVRARKYAASRPDLPITAVSVLTLSTGVSILVHLAAWYLFFACRGLMLEIGAAMPWAAAYLPPAIDNPIETMARLAQGGAIVIDPGSAAIAALTLLVEIGFVFAVLSDEGFDLLFEGIDLGNQGWVYTHVMRPAQNDYRPVAYVVTTLQHDGLGIGFRGMIEDIRQSEKGETLALSLVDPERFLFELAPGKPESGYGAAAVPPRFVRHRDEPVGEVLSLDGKVIQNIVISTPAADRLRRLTQLLDQSDQALPTPAQSHG